MAENETPDEDKLKDAINEAAVIPVGQFTTEDGTVHDVTQLDGLSHQWRRMAVDVVKALDPQAHAKYAEMKYANGGNPDLATRMAAYKFIVCRFLELTYTVAGY